MTLIAKFEISSNYIHFGDLLISGPERIEPTLLIPGMGSVDQIFPEGSGFIPISLRQKVCLLNDYLAVAWAGDKTKAISVVKDLFKLDRPITFDLIKNFFDKLPIEEDVSFIINLIEETTGKAFSGWHGPHSQFPTKRFGEVISAGSGFEHLKFCFDCLEQSQGISVGAPWSKNSRFEMVYNVALLTSLLLTQGLNRTIGEGKHSLLHFFGGGYEAVYNCEGKLRKLENICYVFWNAFCASDGTIDIILNPTIFNSTYNKEILFLRALSGITPTGGASLSIKIKENACYVIQPIHKNFNRDEVLALYKNEFKPEAFCHYTSIFKMDDTPLPNPAVLIETANEPRFKIVENRDFISIDFTLELLKDIKCQVSEVYQKHNRLSS